jgi:hypothetical protein
VRYQEWEGKESEAGFFLLTVRYVSLFPIRERRWPACQARRRHGRPIGQTQGMLVQHSIPTFDTSFRINGNYGIL